MVRQDDDAEWPHIEPSPRMPLQLLASAKFGGEKREEEREREYGVTFGQEKKKTYHNIMGVTAIAGEQGQFKAKGNWGKEVEKNQGEGEIHLGGKRAEKEVNLTERYVNVNANELLPVRTPSKLIAPKTVIQSDSSQLVV